MSMYDRSKFKFSETFNNSDGKTSGSGFIGVILGITAAVTFVAAVIGYFFKLRFTVEVMGEILKLVAASTILLGVRKISGDFARNDNSSAAALAVDAKTAASNEEKG